MNSRQANIKLAAYSSISSLVEYFTVAQDRAEINKYTILDGKTTLTRYLDGDTVEFSSINLGILVKDIISILLENSSNNTDLWHRAGINAIIVIARSIAMSQLLVRNLHEDVVENLKQRARANHRSLQAEVALILENAAKVQPANFWNNTNKLREQLAQSKQLFSDSAELVREDRDKG
ncbi:MAG: Arc family DNA-binding protein [Gammaproteobacteria bacterium]